MKRVHFADENSAKTLCDLFKSGPWAGQRELPKSWILEPWTDLLTTTQLERVTCRRCRAALTQQALERAT